VKVVIIDDEKAMHLIMRRMLAKIADVELVGIFHETAEAFSYLMKQDVDLVFVDISMPRENGLVFAKRLRESGRETKLVFVTSHKEHALSAFDVYAYDYIVKPVKQDRLHKTVQRALSEILSEIGEAVRENTPNGIRFNCLGGVEMRSAQGAIIKWKSSKSAELFGYLLMHKGRLVSRARLTEDIFDGMPQKNAEIYLNTTVYQLRKLLEANELKGGLYSDSNHYALNLSNVFIDILSFEEGCRQMTVIDETNIEQAIELEQLYVGDLFGERAFPWAWSEVERYSLMYTVFAQRLCLALLNRGDIQGAIRLLMKLNAGNELDEAPIMLLMKAFALQKNKEALTRQFMQFVETLHKEMGMSPSLEATMLYKQLLAGLNS
jgi:two-component system LytT family response regulator